MCAKPRGFDCVLIPGAAVGIPGGGVGGALKAEAFCGSGKGLAALGTQVGGEENHFGEQKLEKCPKMTQRCFEAYGAIKRTIIFVAHMPPSLPPKDFPPPYET